MTKPRKTPWLVLLDIGGRVTMCGFSAIDAQEAVQKSIDELESSGVPVDNCRILFVGKGRFGENELATVQ